MAKLKRAVDTTYYGGGNPMSDDPANIINEYLALVREKLPNSIADDVITELETYMLETAADLGDNGQITLESAKKVVAQFGAPGEVADEYRFSMLPETIPEGDIPSEIKQKITEEPKIVEPKEQAPKMQGVDPTTTYSMFFTKSLILTIFWASLASIIPLMFIPYWTLGVQLIFILIPVLCVTTFLLAQTFYLKGKKTILWKRSYPDWSIFQTLVTLPENSIPEAGTKLIRLDIISSFIGVLVFAPTIFQWNHPFGYIIGIPAAILLIARIKLAVRKLDEDKDPYEKSRLEFGVNLSLLVFLESSIYWLFDSMHAPWYYYPFLFGMGPFIATFVVILTPVLLFQLLVGAQNLWWKTEKQSEDSEDVNDENHSEQSLKIGFVSKGLRMFISIVGRLFLFISIPFLVHFFLIPRNVGVYGTINNGVLTGYTLIAVFVAAISVCAYSIGRRLMVQFMKSSTFIGTRSRIESIIDIAISCYLLAGLSAITTMSYPLDFVHRQLLYFSDVFNTSYTLGGIAVGIEVTAILLAFIGLPVRILGDILEFWSKRKFIAILRIQDSSTILFTAITLLATNVYITYVVTGNYFLINMIFLLYLLIAVYLAYQMVASGMKIEEIKEEREKVISEKSQKVLSMNKNTTMAN